MELPGLASDALRDDLAVFVDQDAHRSSSPLALRRSPGAALNLTARPTP
jgi:hypothetical protein